MYITLGYLAEHPEVLPTLAAWFESEWPLHYSTGGHGDAKSDLALYSNRGSVPVGLVAFHESSCCGFAALKNEPFLCYSHLSPWLGAAFVVPSLRRQGIGQQLIGGIESEAKELGYPKIYCATSTADSLLKRCTWQFLEQVERDGQVVSIYQKAL